MSGTFAVQEQAWQIERRADGVLLVRMRSRDRGSQTLPDAVFSFRAGDPQFEYWEQQMRNQERLAG
jgi:hypothetical protein